MRNIMKDNYIQINNRRYLGNKYKLLSFIKDVVNKECSDVKSVADIFAGTGVVASAFADKQLITNDLMYSNFICNYAWFSPDFYDFEKIKYIINHYNSPLTKKEGYMTKTFADTYFSREDCSKIDYIREDIERQFNEKKINNRERAILITSLLYAMDKIAKTCGHYDAFRKNIIFDEHLELKIPDVNNTNNPSNCCYNDDANKIVEHIYADLVYLDPPYNSRQYCDSYHLLENVARWEKPEVSGVARKFDRSGLKSDYCSINATKAFKDLVKKLNCKYILLSYNNMANKGDNRSNAKILDEDIMLILSKKGMTKVFSKNYKAFSAGKSDIKDNQERLFLCEVF